MPQRLRKLVGTLLLVPLLMVYVAAAVTIGDLKVKDAAWPVQAAYFLIAGLAWVLPAGLLIRWMQKPDRTR